MYVNKLPQAPLPKHFLNSDEHNVFALFGMQITSTLFYHFTNVLESLTQFSNFR